MRRIFLDTSYLQTLAAPRDGLHKHAQTVTGKLGLFVAVTSEIMLTELLNALSSESIMS
jgi:predicted nucleic acid-binding protein